MAETQIAIAISGSMGREKLYQPRVEFFVASLTVNICRKTRGEGDGSASGCGAPDLGMLVAGSEAPQRDSARCRSPLGLSKTLVGCRLRNLKGRGRVLRQFPAAAAAAGRQFP